MLALANQNNSFFENSAKVLLTAQPYNTLNFIDRNRYMQLIQVNAAGQFAEGNNV